MACIKHLWRERRLIWYQMSSGNYDKWKLHMSAIQEMVRLRGGISEIDAFVQTKIIR